jgi:hypothetical protein
MRSINVTQKMNSLLEPRAILLGEYCVESVLGQEGMGIVPEFTHQRCAPKTSPPRARMWLAVDETSALVTQPRDRSRTVLVQQSSTMFTIECVGAISPIEVARG